MRRTAVMVLAVLALPVTALAQLQVPASPTATRPASLPGSPPPSSPTAMRPVEVPETTPSQKQERRTPQVRPTGEPPVKPTLPPPPMRPVYNSKGLPVEGMRQAGPNRVFDERTGRYYTTEPSGVGQRIVPPPAGATPQK